ncbi:MAG: Adenine DNA glycosylase [Chlamydiae bacterium]|nr:Adenine DNA glycosylase [Chlamydiota bacterium]
MSDSIDFQSLKDWFLESRRELPWRNNPSPYAVWVSEVMLQQTRASVVVPYFERWMEQFPTVDHLAGASLDEVIKLWEGLGYYSRARNLLAGAQYVQKNYGGKIPETAKELAGIKGLGPYTVGAIRSFAFHRKAAAVDGNVLRVIARHFQIEEDIASGKTVNRIRELLEEILPNVEPWVVNEALIELGATICGKTPQCGECPLRRTCKGRIHGVASSLPIKSSKSRTVQLHRAVAVIQCNGRFLVRRGEAGKVMHDLHEFPFFETEKQGISIEALKKRVFQDLALEVTFLNALSNVSHTFTKYRVHLVPAVFEAKEVKEVEGFLWCSLKELNKLAFSSGHRKIFQMLI